jgi:hypothetical protein
MMENTCVYESCEFGKSLFAKKEQCPFYVESWWTPAQLSGGKPVLIKDCSQKRLFLMVQELYNRMVGVEKSQEELRNETVWTEVVAMVIGKNVGVDLEKMVEERKRMIRLKELEGMKIPKETLQLAASEEEKE